MHKEARSVVLSIATGASASGDPVQLTNQILNGLLEEGWQIHSQSAVLASGGTVTVHVLMVR